jgi:pimeloyl-ACP methyl ester carboxylesterase
VTHPSEPTSRFYDSQGLKLHYADWGNEAAPPLVLLHGGRDHCRSWDWIARAMQPHFHVLAADLRGHGDSDWAKGSSYSMSDHIYDLTRMVGACGIDQMTLVGHSFGGMVSLIYAGAYPEKLRTSSSSTARSCVSRLRRRSTGRCGDGWTTSTGSRLRRRAGIAAWRTRPRACWKRTAG